MASVVEEGREKGVLSHPALSTCCVDQRPWHTLLTLPAALGGGDGIFSIPFYSEKTELNGISVVVE